MIPINEIKAVIVPHFDPYTQKLRTDDEMSQIAYNSIMHTLNSRIPAPDVHTTVSLVSSTDVTDKCPDSPIVTKLRRFIFKIRTP